MKLNIFPIQTVFDDCHFQVFVYASLFFSLPRSIIVVYLLMYLLHHKQPNYMAAAMRSTTRENFPV